MLVRFSNAQLKAHRFREGTLHEMRNENGYGSIDFSPTSDPRIVRVKVYSKRITKYSR